MSAFFIALGVFLTGVVTAGAWFVWKREATREAADAVRSLVRMLWAASVAMVLIGAGAFWQAPSPAGLTLSLPFLLPAVGLTLVYHTTFRNVGLGLLARSVRNAKS